MNKQLLIFLSFSLLLLLLFSCTEQDRVNTNRAVNVFFLGLFQVFNLILFGLSSFILNLIGMLNNNRVLKIIGLVLLIVYVLFGLLGLMYVIEEQPRRNGIYFLFLMEGIIMAASIVFLVMKPRRQQNVVQREINDRPDDRLDF